MLGGLRVVAMAMATLKPGQLGPGLLSVLPCLTLVGAAALVVPLDDFNT